MSQEHKKAQHHHTENNTTHINTVAQSSKLIKGNEEKENQDSSTIDFDAAKAWHFIKKNYWVLLLLIPLILSIYLRTMPIYLPMIDDRAEDNVQQMIKAQLTNQINAQYPNLPEANKQTLVNQEFEKYLLNNKQEYEQIIEQQTNGYKSFFKDDSGQTYLHELDPWHWYRLSRNYVEHGFDMDLEQDGKYYDMYVYAGVPIEKRSGYDKKVNSFHVYIQALFYKIAKIFNNDISLITVSFYTPFIFGNLCLIPAFFIGRKLGGNTGGLISALILSFHKGILPRTSVGFSDTDAYNIFFPLLILWMFILAYDADSLKKRLIYSSLAGLSVGVYSFTWIGWWNIFYFIIAAALLGILVVWLSYLSKKIRSIVFWSGIAVYFAVLISTLTSSVLGNWMVGIVVLGALGCLVYTLLKNLKTELPEIKKGFFENKNSGQVLSVFIAVSFILVVLLVNFRELARILSAPLSFIRFKAVGLTSLWPNVFTTVAEQNSASIPYVINTLGGTLLFIVSLIGVLLAIRSQEEKEKKNGLFVLGLAWIVLISGLWNYVSGKTTMLILLLVVPLIISYIVTAKQKKFTESVLILLLSLSIALLGIYAGKFNNLILYLVLLAGPFIIKYLHSIYLGEIHNKDNSSNKINSIDQNNKCVYYFIIVLWLLLTSYAAVKGIRFSLLSVAPFALAFGIAAYQFATLVSIILKEKLYINQKIMHIIVVIIFLLFLITPYTEGKQTAESLTPLINDQWYNTLINIRDNSQPDAIINSWWDFGHWFKAIGNRSTTLDGGNQNAPQAHWLGKLMLTDNEQESISILRMLDCGGNTAFYELETYFEKDQVKTKKVIDEIIMLPRQDAFDQLKKNGLTTEQTENILQYTHCQAPENFFVTSWDMIGKSGVWAHFGSWDFNRAKIINLANKNDKEGAFDFMQKEMGLTEEEAKKIYVQVKPYGSGTDANTWIAPWPSYKNDLQSCQRKDDIVFCQGIILNLSSNEVFGLQLNNGVQERLYPKVASFIDRKGNYVVKEHNTPDNELKFSNGQEMGISIIGDDAGNYNFVLMDPVLAKSVFNRMYYMLGQDLGCYDLFDASGLNTGSRILVWKVDWNCIDNNKIIVPKTE